MAYRFRRKDRSVGHALRRIAREQVDKAVASIDDDDDRAAAIHDVRKRCKKLRGLIRLARPVFEGYADENARLREIGRLLGGLREAEVLKDTYGQLADRYEQIDRKSLRRFRRGLNEQQTAEGGPANAASRLGECRERLAHARERIGDWTFAVDGWDAIGPGLMLTFTRAQTALEQVEGSRTPELHHELRKRVKYHWHHMRLLRPIAPKDIKYRADMARELSDRLGEHHDLAQLEATLRGGPEAFGPEKDVEVALVLARRHRVLLEEQCLRLARRLLADDPEALAARLRADWQRWRG